MITILWVFALLYAAYIAFAMSLSRLLNRRRDDGRFGGRGTTSSAENQPEAEERA